MTGKLLKPTKRVKRHLNLGVLGSINWENSGAEVIGHQLFKRRGNHLIREMELVSMSLVDLRFKESSAPLNDLPSL